MTATELSESQRNSVRRRGDPEYRERVNAASRRWRKRNPEKVKAQGQRWRMRQPQVEINRKYRSLPSKRLRALVRFRRMMARRKSTRFEQEAFTQIIENPPTKCACCHIDLDYTCGNGKLQTGPSVDQIDPTKGYTVGNVAILCSRCNTRKGALTAEEHRRFAEFIEAHR